MNNLDINKFYDRLIEVFIQDIIFYIPKEKIPTKVLDFLKENSAEDIFDKLLVIDHEGLLSFEREEYGNRLLKKHLLLENNLSQLMKLKEMISTSQFNLIVDKYADQVQFYNFSMQWLLANLELYHQDYMDISTIGIFRIQLGHFKKHFENLKTYFFTSREINLKESYTLFELFEYYLQDLIARYDLSSNNHLIESKKEEQISNKETAIKVAIKTDKELTNKEIRPKKIKKQPPITDEQAKKFLLENVFNVK